MKYSINLSHEQREIILEAIEAYSLIIDQRLKRCTPKTKTYINLSNKLDYLQEISMDILDADQSYDIDYLMYNN
jgi:hypothetical protein